MDYADKKLFPEYQRLVREQKVWHAYLKQKAKSWVESVLPSYSWMLFQLLALHVNPPSDAVVYVLCGLSLVNGCRPNLLNLLSRSYPVNVLCGFVIGQRGCRPNLLDLLSRSYPV